MRVYEFTRFGGPDVLRLGVRDEPVPGPDDVVVETRAIGLNPVDIRQRSGAFRFANPTRFPVVPGNEFSGIVSQVGARVNSVAVGDAVYARTGKARLGALAEKVAVEANLVAPMPRSLDFTAAAAVPLAGATALQGLRDALAVRAGDRLLVTGGSTMVGMFAIQLAGRLGADVVTTASAASEPLLRGLGADDVIDYRSRVTDWDSGRFDKVFDLIGGPEFAALFGLVSPGGRLVSVASTPTPGSLSRDYVMSGRRRATLDTALSLATLADRRRAARHDVTYRFLSMRPGGEDLRELAGLIDDGALEVKVDSVFGFDRAAEAFARVETRRAKGKVVIVTGAMAG